MPKSSRITITYLMYELSTDYIMYRAKQPQNLKTKVGKNSRLPRMRKVGLSSIPLISERLAHAVIHTYLLRSYSKVLIKMSEKHGVNTLEGDTSPERDNISAEEMGFEEGPPSYSTLFTANDLQLPDYSVEPHESTILQGIEQTPSKHKPVN